MILYSMFQNKFPKTLCSDLLYSVQKWCAFVFASLLPTRLAELALDLLVDSPGFACFFIPPLLDTGYQTQPGFVYLSGSKTS